MKYIEFAKRGVIHFSKGFWPMVLYKCVLWHVRRLVQVQAHNELGYIVSTGNSCRSFEGSYYLHLQGRPVKYLWRWRHHDSSEHRLLFTYIYSITSQKTWIFVSSSVRTWDLGVYIDALYAIVLTAVTCSCVCFGSSLILSRFLCISSL